MAYNRTSKVLSILVFASLFPIVAASLAYALPFNDDMVNNQLKTGQIMRPKPDGSIAVGSLQYHVASKPEAEKLENPIKADNVSVRKGERLFRINCFPCHGDITTKEYKGGPVASKFVMPPDITGDAYKQKTDGYIYSTIHFGGLAIMPALGWKLSPREHWDIINYIRKVQSSK